MDSATWGFIGTIVGAIVGASASIGTSIINAKNSTRQQTNLENYKRQEVLREFQRDNCLKLQEALFKSIRLRTLLHLEDVENLCKTGEWQKALLDTEKDVNLMLALKDLSVYSERLQNEELRKELKQFKAKVSSMGMTPSKEVSDRIMSGLIKDYDIITADLGVELRKNY